METTVKLGEWPANMGYQDKMPSNLKTICNPSTVIIWEQLINKTRSKQEVEYMKSNILIKRLLKHDDTLNFPHLLMFQAKSDYPIKEIVVWDKNVTLKQHLDTAKYRIDELHSELDNANKQNKIKYINLDNLKQKLHDHRQFIFLLDSKTKALEAEINDTEELLKQERNSTPIEMTEQNDDDVVNTLNKCSEKLCKIIEQQRSFCNNGNITMSLIPEHSIATVYSKQIFDESFGLLDDSMSFTGAAASSFISTSNFPNYELAILNDEVLHKTLEDQLHSKDRGTIWNAINKFSKTFQVELINGVTDNYKISQSPPKTDNKEERKLYAVHVEYELKTIKTICEIQGLQEELNRLSEISNSKYPDCFRNQSRLYLKKIGIDAASQQVQGLINKMKSSLNVKNDLRIANEKVCTIQDDIERKLNDIKYKTATFKEVLEVTFQIRNKISLSMKQLAPFTVDLNWTMALDSSMNSVEVQTFLEFPLEYNRVLLHGGVKMFARDISLNRIPYEEKLDSNFIHMLLAILRSPCIPVEILLVNIVKASLKMNQVKALQHLPEYYKDLEYTIDGLQKQDTYLNCALDKLKSFVSTHSTNKNGSSLAQLKSTSNLWLEMPMKNVVQHEQLYNDKPYSYYEKLFDSYYSQL